MKKLNKYLKIKKEYDVIASKHNNNRYYSTLNNVYVFAFVTFASILCLCSQFNIYSINYSEFFLSILNLDFSFIKGTDFNNRYGYSYKDVFHLLFFSNLSILLSFSFITNLFLSMKIDKLTLKKSLKNIVFYLKNNKLNTSFILLAFVFLSAIYSFFPILFLMSVLSFLYLAFFCVSFLFQKKPDVHEQGTLEKLKIELNNIKAEIKADSNELINLSRLNYKESEDNIKELIDDIISNNLNDNLESLLLKNIANQKQTILINNE